jgi:hypothetical protein
MRQVIAKDIFLSKPVLGYHGSNSKLKALIPREVTNLGSIGTWVTLSPSAAKMYGPNVHQVIVPEGRYLRAHSDDFYKMFVTLPLVDKHFSKDEADLIKAGFFGHKPPKMKQWEWNTLSEEDMKRVEGDWKATFKKAFRNPAYLKDWRKMIKGAGYNGVVWARSRIDLRKEDKPHTVILVFEHKPMRTVLMKDAHLRKAAIRLAHEKPELRPYLIPVLKQAAFDERDAAKVLKEVGRYFEKKYGLSYRFDPKGNVWGDGPEVTIWDEGDEPHYAASLSVSWENTMSLDHGEYSIDIFQRPGSAGTSVDGPISARNLIKMAERFAKKESDLI